MINILTITLNPAIDRTLYVDNLILGNLNMIKENKKDFGGKGINVSKALQNFNMNVVTTGFISGSDKEFIKDLKRKRLNPSFIKIKGDTRNNYKIVDLKLNNLTELNNKGFIVSDKEVNKFNIKLNRLMKKVDYMVLSGSIPNGIEKSIYKNYIKQARKNSVKTILDCDGILLKEGIKGLPYAIKPNIHELEGLVGYKITNYREIVNVSKKLIDKGIKVIITSMGIDGAIIVTEKNAIKSNSLKINFNCSVGAGDSMVGAFIYTLINNFDLNNSLKFITAAGSITASKPGSMLCELDEVQRVYKDVYIKNLKKYI